MEAGTSTQPGPSTAHRNAHYHSRSSGASDRAMPEDQTHHKPFFYVQPSQPFLPSMQWPMPLAMPLNYSPYYGGYPGFGYGLPLMPHLQPGPFMDAPGFVVPHTHLHLMDYRRILNPQYYHSMAYHARRLRYQQNAPQRAVTNSEVQTEPVSASPRSNVASVNPSQTCREPSNLSTAASVQSDCHTMMMNELEPVSTNVTPQKGTFVLETEEVRIQCCATPAGLQVMHSQDSPEMSRRFAQNVVHCSSIVQNSLMPGEDSQNVNVEGNSRPSHQTCPDILIIAPSENDQNLLTEKTWTNCPRIRIANNVDTIRSESNVKIVRLPFDAKYLEELRKIESTVWSTEDTLVPSPDFKSCNETLRDEVSAVEMVVVATAEENAQEKHAPIVHLPKSVGKGSEDVESTLENPLEKIVQKEVLKQIFLNGKIKNNFSQNPLLSEDLPMDGELHDLHDTSFESLPAYLPSSSWLADFDNASNGKLPIQKLNKQLENRSLNVPLRFRKLDVNFKEVAEIRKSKEMFKQIRKVDQRSLSDNECCIKRGYNENSYISCTTKAQRLCMRCLSKQKLYKSSPSPTQLSKRKGAPFQSQNDLTLPTCEACKCHMVKRILRKGSNSEARNEAHVESSNGYRRKFVEDLKRPLASKQNMETTPATFIKLKERNCLCREFHHQPIQSKKFYQCPRGNAIRERNENRVVKNNSDSWRNKEPMYLSHHWSTDRPWKTMPVHNMETLKKDLLRAQHTTEHKNSLSLSQGLYRRDTRC